MTTNQVATAANQGGKARCIAFRLAVVLPVLLVGVALLQAFPFIAVNWLPRDTWLVARADRFHPDLSPGDEVHCLHSLA